MSESGLVCPLCASTSFCVKYEATYVYSYLIDSDAPGIKNTEEFLPFLFDSREQKETKQFIECGKCGAKFNCYFNQWDNKIDITDLQSALKKQP
ncbi:hypothetical protein LY28_01989 [Ruminiclostridium sufflavum DSM 19573]|uniref:Uncharacterized protein n=1 Tax=Ruminiclostridium sufflavum DSM 19573 TaxID=1121337 RepID=A0A318XXU8_9FIRM|nr:hypothetical protein [Ruminiclostridium sufflavum]PYG87617.1 hypothetical protein LY28_01989 [Ruminiclostridium sufflavum DSM 19573]